MPNRPAAVTEAAIVRALRAARRAGAAVVEIYPDGKVLVRLDRTADVADDASVVDEPEIVM